MYHATKARKTAVGASTSASEPKSERQLGPAMQKPQQKKR
jgi:hypothetical protein